MGLGWPDLFRRVLAPRRRDIGKAGRHAAAHFLNAATQFGDIKHLLDAENAAVEVIDLAFNDFQSGFNSIKAGFNPIKAGFNAALTSFEFGLTSFEFGLTSFELRLTGD
jgi:hypothetical protein